MALHLGDAVTRGFVDNREKGRVRGMLWLRGRSRPLQLDLEGDAHPDLAGRRVHFRRLDAPLALAGVPELSGVQRGRLGDLTARRPVQVPTLPGLTAGSHPWGKRTSAVQTIEAFYLEWFMPSHRRVVVEMLDFSMRRSRPVWTPTEADERKRAQAVEAAWRRYLAEWDAFIARLDRSVKDPEEAWDEYDYERFLKVCEARSEKYNELVERYGDSPEARARIARDMGWEIDETLLEEDLDEEDVLGPEEAELFGSQPDPDPAREGVDWVRTPDGEICHPLEVRWAELLQRVEGALQQHLGRAEFSAHPEAIALLAQFRLTGSRLTGALRGVAWGETELEAGLVVACLKRALHGLHETHRCLRATCESAGLSSAQTARLQRDLFLIREEVLGLMQEYRQR